MRREYKMHYAMLKGVQGLPLHAQGIPIARKQQIKAAGITPACTGNTFFLSFFCNVRWDYPCMRREYLTASNCLNDPEGLPLHAQGILSLSSCRHASDGITPACAGNTTEFDYEATKSWDYPCMRREYRHAIFQQLCNAGLPLHAQGIHTFKELVMNAGGITPACAGNTMHITVSTRLTRDYPCMRREYSILNMFHQQVMGLPLHAQGIPYRNLCVST